MNVKVCIKIVAEFSRVIEFMFSIVEAKVLRKSLYLFMCIEYYNKYAEF